MSVSVYNGTVKDVLHETAHQLGYKWVIKDNTIFFYLLAPNAYNNLPHTTHISSNSDISGNRNYAKQQWELNIQDKTLKDALRKWCKISGWQLIWHVDVDYPIVASWTLWGSFESAINQVLQSSQQLNIPLFATMHDDNRVLEVYSSKYKSSTY